MNYSIGEKILEKSHKYGSSILYTMVLFEQRQKTVNLASMNYEKVCFSKEYRIVWQESRKKNFQQKYYFQSDL